MDPHSVFSDQDPAVFLYVDPDPAAFKCGSGSSVINYLMKNYHMKSFLLKMDEQECSKVKKWSRSKFTEVFFITVIASFFAFFLLFTKMSLLHPDQQPCSELRSF